MCVQSRGEYLLSFRSARLYESHGCRLQKHLAPVCSEVEQHGRDVGGPWIFGTTHFEFAWSHILIVFKEDDMFFLLKTLK